jgi:hypothetical protein
MALPHCCGPGPRPSVQFKYNLRTSIRPYLLGQSIVGDNLVSVRQGRASSMSKTNAGCVTNKEVTLKDVIARLAAIEDIILPLQPLHDQVTTLQATVADQQQQAVFNIALTHVKTTMCDRGLGGGNGRCRNAGEEMMIQIFLRSTSLSFPSTMARVTHSHGSITAITTSRYVIRCSTKKFCTPHSMSSMMHSFGSTDLSSTTASPIRCASSSSWISASGRRSAI